MLIFPIPCPEPYSPRLLLQNSQFQPSLIDTVKASALLGWVFSNDFSFKLSINLHMMQKFLMIIVSVMDGKDKVMNTEGHGRTDRENFNVT